MKPIEMTVPELTNLTLQWLKMFDDGDFLKCWEYASPELKKQVNEQDFSEIMSSKRLDKGAVLLRKLQDNGCELTYHKRPELIHRVLQYEVTLVTGTKFQELVTVVQDKGSSWQVANYIIL